MKPKIRMPIGLGEAGRVASTCTQHLLNTSLTSLSLHCRWVSDKEPVGGGVQGQFRCSADCRVYAESSCICAYAGAQRAANCCRAIQCQVQTEAAPSDIGIACLAVAPSLIVIYDCCSKYCFIYGPLMSLPLSFVSTLLLTRY